MLCAYLRMPYTPPPTKSPVRRLSGLRAHRPAHTRPAADGAPTATTSDQNQNRVQEREVRLTAQRVLARHLRPGEDPATPAKTFWADIDLDLTAASLIDLDFSDCAIREAQFARTTFIGNARFDRATFGPAWFDRSTFTSDAWFDQAAFTSDARFYEATFTGDARFDKATFSGRATFHEVNFTGAARFDQATFNDYTVFTGATFTNWAKYAMATFSVGPWFHSATFHHNTLFARATFATGQGFNEVTFPSNRYVDHNTPWPWMDFTDARFGDQLGPQEIRQFPHTTLDHNAAPPEPTH